jgi:hypothetical protein
MTQDLMVSKEYLRSINATKIIANTSIRIGQSESTVDLSCFYKFTFAPPKIIGITEPSLKITIFEETKLYAIIGVEIINAESLISENTTLFYTIKTDNDFVSFKI